MFTYLYLCPFYPDRELEYCHNPTFPYQINPAGPSSRFQSFSQPLISFVCSWTSEKRNHVACTLLGKASFTQQNFLRSAMELCRMICSVFLRLWNVPRRGNNTAYLFTLFLVDIWAVSNLWLLWLNLCMSFGGHKSSPPLLGRYLDMELPSHTVGICFTLPDYSKSFIFSVDFEFCLPW